GQLLGLATELHLELLAICGVADNLGKALERAPLVAQGGDDHAAPEPRPVAPDLPLLAAHLAAGGGLADLCLGSARLAILGDEEAREGLADDVGGMVAEQEGGPVVPAQHAPLGVEQEDGVILDTVQEQLDPLLIDRGGLLPRDFV